MELQKKKRCNWLKGLDQIGVPASMHYDGDSTKSTRIGGLVSIVGLALVLSFVFGTISMYIAFSNVKTNVTTTGIDPVTLLDCSADGNMCQ